MWIYEHQDCPNFTWDAAILASQLADIRHRQGRLLGRMEGLGFELKREASLNTLIQDVVKSSAIEGENLNPEEVHSSIARRLGIDIAGLTPASRNVEGIVEMMLDATQQFSKPLTQDRLFNWHAALFSTGRSGMHNITVANCALLTSIRCKLFLVLLVKKRFTLKLQMQQIYKKCIFPPNWISYSWNWITQSRLNWISQ